MIFYNLLKIKCIKLSNLWQKFELSQRQSSLLISVGILHYLM